MATTKVTQPVIDLNGVAAATDVSALKMPAGGAPPGEGEESTSCQLTRSAAGVRNS